MTWIESTYTLLTGPEIINIHMQDTYGETCHENNGIRLSICTTTTQQQKEEAMMSLIQVKTPYWTLSSTYIRLVVAPTVAT